MTRWIDPPVGGFGHWTARPPEVGPAPRPPVRLQGERPTIALSTTTVTMASELPSGDLSRLLIDGEPLCLSRVVLEHVDLVRTGEIVLLVADTESWIPGHWLRLHLHFEDAQIDEMDDDVASVRGPSGLRRVDSLQHDGDGTFRLTIWFSGADQPLRFPHAQFRASSVWAQIQPLDARRPPYVAVWQETGTDGLWVGGHPESDEPAHIDDLDVPDDLRRRIRHWNDSPNTSEAERLAIVARLRALWPDSVVT